jgi:hypothetical protein
LRTLSEELLNNIEQIKEFKFKESAWNKVEEDYKD